MKHLKTKKFNITHFQDYVSTYHERYPDQQDIMFQDMFYGLGICVDPEKYKGADGFRKFIEWIVEAHRLDEDEEMMREMAEEENQRMKDDEKHNNKILSELEYLGGKYIENIMECLKESEAHGRLEIVNKSDIRKQIDKQMEDWETFDHIYVDQYLDGGMSGDAFAGYIYIPLKKEKYLKSHYSM